MERAAAVARIAQHLHIVLRCDLLSQAPSAAWQAVAKRSERPGFVSERALAKWNPDREHELGIEALLHGFKRLLRSPRPGPSGERRPLSNEHRGAPRFSPSLLSQPMCAQA